jgi:hypothetical protein
VAPNRACALAELTWAELGFPISTDRRNVPRKTTTR